MLLGFLKTTSKFQSTCLKEGEISRRISRVYGFSGSIIGAEKN
jgi:hypothetical protein